MNVNCVNMVFSWGGEWCCSVDVVAMACGCREVNSVPGYHIGCTKMSPCAASVHFLKNTVVCKNFFTCH